MTNDLFSFAVVPNVVFFSRQSILSLLLRLGMHKIEHTKLTTCAHENERVMVEHMM